MPKVPPLRTRAEYEALAARVPALEAELAEQQAQNAQLLATIGELRVRIAELEEQLGQDSNNSSRPPSSDGPKVQRPKKKKTGRARGGQPGHERKTRPLVPPEQVSQTVECKPEVCEQCAGELKGDDPTPERHQVFDLPPIRPIVTEYQRHALTCPQCAHVTQGKLPPSVPRGSFGPTVVAIVALLMGVFRQSRRQVVALMKELFDLDMSVGSVVNCQKFATDALEPPVEEAYEAAKAAPVKNMDETGWKLRNLYACLWTLVTPLVTVFRIQASRGREAARAMFGKVEGILGSDRYAVYSIWPSRQHQFCWAHLKRLFTKFSQRPGDVGPIGQKLLAETHRLFGWWHRVRDGTLSRASLQRYVATMKGRVEALLVAGAGSSCAKTAATCTNLLGSKDALWTFVYHEGVEPTNNAAEQALRHPVILRKLCFGSQSEHGCRFLERVMTVYATLQRQKRNAHDFILRACRAKLAGTPAPSLLPGPQAVTP